MSRFPLSSTPISQHPPKPWILGISRLSRSFALLSPSAGSPHDSLVIGVNDDEAEKKELREQRVRKSLAERPRVPPQEYLSPEIIQQLSTSKREEHFQLCMKLSAENKISEKNAFRLHLIEYLTEMIKRRSESAPNFQMASMTLHASAKLYAVKVDCLHYITVKMANKICDPVSTDATQAKKKHGSEGEDRDDNYDEARRQKRTERRAQRKLKSYVAEDISAIDWGYVDEVITEIKKPHAKYDLVTSVFKDGKHGGLMSHLRMQSDAKAMILAETVPYISGKEAWNIAEAKNVPENVKCLMTKAAKGEAEISQTLSLFSFHDLKWPLDASTPLEREKGNCVPYRKTLSSADCSEAQQLMRQVSIPPTDNITAMSSLDSQSQPYESIHEDFHDVEENEDIPKEMNKQRQTVLEREKDSSCFKNMSLRRLRAFFSNTRYDPPHLPKIEISVVDVTACLSSEPTEYSPFDPKLQAIFLGRQTFRAKGLPSHTQEISDTAGTSEVGRKKKKNLLFTFEKQELAGVRSKIRRGKHSTYTAHYPEDWKEDSITWPTWASDDSVLLSVFLKPTCSVEDRGDKTELKIAPDGEADMDYESFASFYGEDVGCERENSGFNHENVLLKPRKSGIDDYQDEVPSPYISQMQDEIPYATTAKQVDQQTVKRLLWSVISEGTTDNIGSIKSQVRGGFEEKDFGHVYKKVKHMLPEPMKEDISIPIAFVILLQLTNEHALQLKTSSDLKRLVIWRPRNRPPPA